MKNTLLIIILGLFALSCKTKKTLSTDSGNDSIRVNNDLPKDINKPINADLVFWENVLIPPKFEQIKINSKLTIESEQSILPTMDATIYIQKDEKIWMNLSYFINVARGTATPEGIKAYVKTDRTYIDSDFDYLNNLLNTNLINYKALEKMLIGRTFVKINDRDFLLSKNPKGYKMSSLVNQKMETNGKIREYKIDVYYAPNYDLEIVHLQDVNTADELQVNYENWEEFRNYRMPKNVKIIIKGTKSSQILIENTKFDDIKMQTPFSIPVNYKKIEI